jgi:glycolate oxidase FAD binding subunit
VSDIAADVIERIRAARAARSTLAIRGHRSKRRLLGSPGGQADLDLGLHCGIIDYQPEELVITARAGTPLSDITAALDEHGQCLAAEPPMFAGRGTLGGAVASGLSGPARPFRGSLRDCVLGVEVINGLAERLRFGGQVFKNVAGFDVSRMLTGSEGAFGVVLAASLRVAPKPERVECRKLMMNAPAAVICMRNWASQSLPLSGLAWSAGELHWRLAGAACVVKDVADQLSGVEEDPGFWSDLRDGELPLLSSTRLWRHAVPPSTHPDAADVCIDWAGALRWRRQDESLDSMVPGESACQLGSSPLQPDRVSALVRRLKDAFDPDHIFNPGLIHADPTA